MPPFPRELRSPCWPEILRVLDSEPVPEQSVARPNSQNGESIRYMALTRRSATVHLGSSEYIRHAFL